MKKNFVVTGGKAAGKTSFTEKLAELLKDKKNLHISGFLSKGFWENNQRSHYVLRDFQTGQNLLLCKAGKTLGWIEGGPYSFNPEAIRMGEKIIATISANCQLIILDEIGKLELNEKIWHRLLTGLVHKNNCNLLLVIREEFVQQVIEKYRIHNVNILNISQTNPESAAQLIHRSITTAS